jgi:hypothetical protein
VDKYSFKEAAKALLDEVPTNAQASAIILLLGEFIFTSGEGKPVTLHTYTQSEVDNDDHPEYKRGWNECLDAVDIPPRK